VLTNLLLFAILLLVAAVAKKLWSAANKIMATQADLDAALDKLGKAVSDAATRISNDLSALQAKVAAIPAAADLAPEVARIGAMADAVAAIDPAAPTPIAPPTPAP
jgi:hypothetical protein